MCISYFNAGVGVYVFVLFLHSSLHSFNECVHTLRSLLYALHTQIRQLEAKLLLVESSSQVSQAL